MIIGISGKLGSGKDTVAEIIQYLTDPYAKEDELTFEEWREENAGIPAGHQPHASDWTIVKYADKLKDIVCMLIGCTRDQLEDRDFKESKLSDEWDFIRVSYKDRAGSFIALPTEENLEEYEGRILYHGTLTPRLMLQLLGTEAGRQIIHPNIWVNATMADYYQDTGFTYPVKPTGKSSGESVELEILGEPEPYVGNYPNWIITDMRFPNEKKAVEDLHGITLRVERLTNLRVPELWNEFQNQEKWDSWDDFLVTKGQLEKVYHASETALDNDDVWDIVIENNGTIEELIEEVRAHLTYLQENNTNESYKYIL